MPQAEVVKAKAKPSLVLKQQYGARKLVTKSVNPLIPKHHRTVKADLDNAAWLPEGWTLRSNGVDGENNADT